jgi:hypothetical protein
MEELPTRHPRVYDVFRKGHVTNRKTHCASSATSDDHLHEQNKKMIKGDGEAIGILVNESALLKRMVGGPEISQMVQEFEVTANNKATTNNDIQHHHKATKSFQSRLSRHVSAVVESMQQDGNPFAQQELKIVDSKKRFMTASAERSAFEPRTTRQQKYANLAADHFAYGLGFVALASTR